MNQSTTAATVNKGEGSGNDKNGSAASASPKVVTSKDTDELVARDGALRHGTTVPPSRQAKTTRT